MADVASVKAQMHDFNKKLHRQIAIHDYENAMKVVYIHVIGVI